MPAQCAFGPASHDLSVLRAARGQRVLCGTEWTLCAPTGGGALPGSAASPVPAARARALARERARVRPEPISLTLRTHVLQPARCGARRACGEAQVGRRCARVSRGSVARSVALRVVRAFPVFEGHARAARQATWLILPVVICLSQRLSHACLSISDLYCETANGSLNQLWFL